jgi:phosphomannomutase
MSLPSTPTIYRFGTSGYRTPNAAIGFTPAIVQQLVHAVADYWLTHHHANPTHAAVIVSYDKRPISAERLPLVVATLQARGFNVWVTPTDLPIPLAAFAAKYPALCGIQPAKAFGAIYIGASHNPPEHAGLNVLSPDGAVVASAQSAYIESMQATPLPHAAEPAGTVNTVEVYAAYVRHLLGTVGINVPAMAQAPVHIFYDALFATGRNVMPQLLAQAGVPHTCLHTAEAPPAGWHGMPNPTPHELRTLQTFMQADPAPALLRLGLSNDGDADRFGVLDEHGQYVPPNDVLLLVLYSLITHKWPNTPYVLARSQATSHALDALALAHGWSVLVTPVGYKYLAETFIEHEQQGKAPIGLGAEASGGLSIAGHIPEKDGILADLLVAELVAVTGTPLSHLLTRIKQALPCAYAFAEYASPTPNGDSILTALLAATKQPTAFTGFTLDETGTHALATHLQTQFGTRDGVKLLFTDGAWVLFRKSGTEPLVRLVIEATGTTEAQAQAQHQLLAQAVLAFIAQHTGDELTLSSH